MKTKFVRTLAMTVAAISLLSVSAFAQEYNTSRISGTANRILDGTEKINGQSEGPATILRGGVDTISSTKNGTDPESLRITYNYDGKSETDEQKVRDGKLGWSGYTYTYTPYSVKKKSGNGMTYEYWKVTKTEAPLSEAYKVRVVKVSPNNPTLTKAPTVNTVTYTGAAQQLAVAGKATNGKVQYQVNNGSWSDNVPTATAAGEYTIAYRVAGVGKFNTLAPVTITTKAKINKADSELTTVPAPKTVTWSGEAQELISAGAATGGKVQYKLGDGDWSENIPTATAVGSYTVSYKVVGDENHNDIAEASVTATIEDKAATATYKNVGNVSGAGYDGEASAWSVTVTPGSTAIESIDVKVNDLKKSEEGAWTETVLFGGPVTFGVAIDAAADMINSIKAVVNGSDIETTRID